MNAGGVKSARDEWALHCQQCFAHLGQVISGDNPEDSTALNQCLRPSINLRLHGSTSPSLQLSGLVLNEALTLTVAEFFFPSRQSSPSSFNFDV